MGSRALESMTVAFCNRHETGSNVLKTIGNTIVLLATITLVAYATGLCESGPKTSKWVIRNYVDEFGDPIKQSYMTNINRIRGTFSNTATEDSHLDSYFLVENPWDISIKLYEYAGNNPVKGYSDNKYTVLVKADDGTRFRLSATNNSDRLSIGGTDSKILHDAFIEYRTLKFHIVEVETPTTKYDFTVDATGYTATYLRLKKQNRKEAPKVSANLKGETFMCPNDWIIGTYSNLVTPVSPLDVCFQIEKDRIVINMWAGTGRTTVLNSTDYIVNIEADDGTQLLVNVSKRFESLIMKMSDDNGSQLHSFLLKYKTLRFHIEDHYTTKYDFTIDATGYTATSNKL